MLSPAERIKALEERTAIHPHGTRMRYRQGCRCVPCGAANSRYETHRRRERLKGRPNGYVATTDVRLHLIRLRHAGVGYKQVAKIAGVGKTLLAAILSGDRDNMREQNARRVLAVTPHDKADHALVSAALTWKRINWLIGPGGFTRAGLARELGSKARIPALQIRRDRVTVRTAKHVQRIYEYYHYE